MNKRWQRPILLLCWLLMLAGCKVQQYPYAVVATTTPLAFTGQPILLSAKGSTDLDGHVVSYLFDFGDGEAVEVAAETSEVTHTYEQAGQYQVNVQATDNDGLTSQSRSLTLLIARPGSGEIQMDPPVYSGTGCPSDSLQATLTFDQRTLSILYDRFYLQSNRRNTNLKSACSINIPLKLAQPYRIVLVSIDQRGQVESPSGSAATLQTQYAFDENPFSTLYYDLSGQQTLFTQTEQLVSPVLSYCSDQHQLQIHTELSINALNQSNTTAIFLDSTDLVAGADYQFGLVPCETE